MALLDQIKNFMGQKAPAKPLPPASSIPTRPVQKIRTTTRPRPRAPVKG